MKRPKSFKHPTKWDNKTQLIALDVLERDGDFVVSYDRPIANAERNKLYGYLRACKLAKKKEPWYLAMITAFEEVALCLPNDYEIHVQRETQLDVEKFLAESGVDATIERLRDYQQGITQEERERMEQEAKHTHHEYTDFEELDEDGEEVAY